MTESKLSVSERELHEAQKYLTYIQAAKEGVDTAIEQGLWVAFMIDMAAISGRVYKKKDRFLYDQRTFLIDTIDFMTMQEWDMPPPIPDIPKVTGYLFAWLRPMKNELNNTAFDAEGGRYYVEMDPVPKLILIFMFPGIMRLILSQLGDIMPM